MSATDADSRGLMLISALINFVDWLDGERLLKRLPDGERAASTEILRRASAR